VPLALLLQQTVIAALRGAATTLLPWIEIVAREATIVERARSAFLVHWFGPRLPFTGLSLRVMLANEHALMDQFERARRSIPRTQEGPTLTQPLAAFAGQLVGIALSPVGAIAGVSVLLRYAGFSIKVILGALAWVAVPALLVTGMVVAPAGTAVLFGGLITAGAGGFALAGGLGDRRDLRALLNVFTALGGLMNASVDLIDQLLGPREAIRNPLLRSLLDLADRFAALLPQVMGALAFLIVRIGPLMQPVARIMVALGGLASATSDAVSVIVAGLQARLDEVFEGRLALVPVIDRALGTARSQWALVTNALGGIPDVITTNIEELRDRLVESFELFVASLGLFFRRFFRRHPVARVLRGLADEVEVVTKAFASAAPATPSKPGLFDPLLAALPSLPPVADFPKLALPDTERIRQAMGAEPAALTIAEIERAAGRLGTPPSERIRLTGEGRAAVTALIGRASVFRDERASLEERLRQSLEKAGLELGPIREALALVVARILPPEMRASILPVLTPQLERLDAELLGTRRTRATLPDLEVPDLIPLRPVVRKLRFRAPGASVADVRRFQDVILPILQRQPYQYSAATVPAGS
jgi:hypothetical protein